MSQPASAAAAEEEHAAWAWAGALDVDDSDIRRCPASSLSPLRSSAASRPEGHGSAATRCVPAPAASLVHGTTRLRSPLLPSVGPAARGDGQAADPDFSLSPWLHALGSLGEIGYGEGRGWKRQEIAAIRGDRALYRARLVSTGIMA
ncbi:hypothetical protein E2562_009241 [Oryza meyeriana var. granulata]|uniref:Uncharacterized protein n=1 Tax=Oryza meyeriana var. granulata TaxID=110450 RepID=A0A6G1D1C4_9ORYZ|nr:hypothetical protein E2562_009241 [Oryza meyeriana var. granulata]